MAKKCLPGVICIENMTLMILIVLCLIIGYLYYITKLNKPLDTPASSIVVVSPPSLTGISTRSDAMSDPYNPPLRNDGYYFPRDSADVRGIPINIKTRGTGMDYTQIGILTRPNIRNGHDGEMILPLMGRKLMSGRDKWQYYTISNTGNMNTKLPVSLNGKSCTGEYGCDEIHNNDTVYVEGYKDTFVATIYENSTFSYIPYI
jgi:hypothetical protein